MEFTTGSLKKKKQGLKPRLKLEDFVLFCLVHILLIRCPEAIRALALQIDTVSAPGKFSCPSCWIIRLRSCNDRPAMKENGLILLRSSISAVNYRINRNILQSKQEAVKRFLSVISMFRFCFVRCVPGFRAPMCVLPFLDCVLFKRK